MFENQSNGVANSLVYDIAIPVSCVLDLPPDAGPDSGNAFPRETEVRLDFIRIGLVDWRDLPGRAFVFPVNPAEGYVDGSVYFGHQHHYADLTRLHFGRLNGSTMTALATITFNFYKMSELPGLPETLTVD